MARSRSSSALAAANKEGANADPDLPYPLTYLVTPSEVTSIQSILAKARIVPPPAPSASPSNGPSGAPTPTSVPSTPVSAIPPRLTAITIESVGKQGEQAAEGLGSKSSWLQDEALPLISRSATRAALAGWTANVLLEGVLPLVLRKKTPRETLQSMASKGSVLVATSLGLYALLYRVITRLLSIVRLKLLSRLPSLAPVNLTSDTNRAKAFSRLVRAMRSGLLVPFLASLIASPSLILLPRTNPTRPGQPSFPRQSLALDMFTKGWRSAYHEMRKNNAALVRWIPAWVNGALLYAVGNGQLLWAFLFDKDAFPEGYGKLILARSSAYIPQRPHDLPAELPWPTAREIADHVAILSTPTKTSSAFPTFSSPHLSALTPPPYPTTDFKVINPVLDYSPSHPSHTQLLCALLHPGEPSCRKNFLSFWAQEWKASARFVALFLGALNVVFGWKKWLKDPEKALFGFALSVVQGATVISGSIGSAWALTCLFQHYLPRNFLPRSRYFLNGFLSSIFILAVPASRRSELGLYVGKMSMDSSWQVLSKRGRVRALPHGDVLLLALGLSSLLALYEDRPKSISGGMKTFLSILVGKRTGGKVGMDKLSWASKNQQDEAERKFKESGDFAASASGSSSTVEKSGAAAGEGEKRVNKARFEL